MNGTTAANSAGVLVPQFIYPVADPIALALGSQSLQPEESTSFTAGLIFLPFHNTSITLDSSGKAHIGYNDIEADELKYATNASGSWVTTIVDSGLGYDAAPTGWTYGDLATALDS